MSDTDKLEQAELNPVDSAQAPWWQGQQAPKVYNYHPETGAYVGVSEADYSPLDEGVWLVPANATLEPVPADGLGDNDFYAYMVDRWVVLSRQLPPVPPEPTDLEKAVVELAALDHQLSPAMEELLIVNKLTITPAAEKIIERKKELRADIKRLSK